MNQFGVTILWALRSPCPLGCRYCYFGSADDPRSPANLNVGQLSHSGRGDLALGDMLEFVETIPRGVVRRVFLAGGEPLVWSGTLQVAGALRRRGVEVAIATNGQPLSERGMSEALVGLPAFAVSVSLDSVDSAYNDEWRVDRTGNGWSRVVDGIKTMVEVRDRHKAATRVGVYSVITRVNIGHIAATTAFVESLGADFHVIQPVSLAETHPLHDELSLRSEDYVRMYEAMRLMPRLTPRFPTLDPTYAQRVFSLQNKRSLPTVDKCFGGRDLFFIEPDGSVWDCPSSYKIAATSSTARRSIKGATAEGLFGAERRGRNTDCSLFSDDCVNMWQLMSFDGLAK